MNRRTLLQSVVAVVAAPLVCRNTAAASPAPVPAKYIPPGWNPRGHRFLVAESERGRITFRDIPGVKLGDRVRVEGSAQLAGDWTVTEENWFPSPP